MVKFMENITTGLISVIIPVYNTEIYLRRCINSVLNQSYKHLEIILIDDGSSDGSGKICDEYQMKDNRIKVIHQENAGQAAARNRGLDAANGNYIAFVDSDDYIEADMMEYLLNNLTEYNADIAVCGVKKVNLHGVTAGYFNENLKDFFVFDTYQAMEQLIDNKIINFSLCDKLFRRTLFEQLRFREGIIFEDMELIYQLVDKAKKIVYSAEVKYNYVLSDDSTIRQVFNIKKMSAIYVYEEILQFYKNKYPEFYEHALCFFMDICLSNLYEIEITKNFKQEKKYLLKRIWEIYPAVINSPHCRKAVKIKLKALKMNIHMFILLSNIVKIIKKTRH